MEITFHKHALQVHPNQIYHGFQQQFSDLGTDKTTSQCVLKNQNNNTECIQLIPPSRFCDTVFLLYVQSTVAFSDQI